jgi:preprotein translocase subunit SecY
VETIFYTLQDYYTHTKAISYLLMIASLIGFALFWKFISAKDDADK